MTMKNLLAIIIALFLSINLSACTNQFQSDEYIDESYSGTFKLVVKEKMKDYYETEQIIFYDKDTKVMYTDFIGSTVPGADFASSVLYNADGTLKLYSSTVKYQPFTIVEVDVLEYENTRVIMYDPETMVMYTYRQVNFLTTVYRSSLNVLYNADGTLKLYSSGN